jgi:hypothetical protein
VVVGELYSRDSAFILIVGVTGRSPMIGSWFLILQFLRELQDIAALRDIAQA